MKIVIKDKFGNKFASFDVFNYHRFEETYIDLESLEDCSVAGATEEEKLNGCMRDDVNSVRGKEVDVIIDTRIKPRSTP